MSYAKQTWTTSSRVSAQALNHLETQYDEVMALESTWNNHDTRYYLKSEAITKFYSASYMGTAAGVDADLLDGHHLTDLMGTGLPVGAIVWWAKDSGSIPSGWYMCNGANGTNDYRDRFVIGASASYSLKSLYGAASVTPTTSSVTIGGTAIDSTMIPGHTHSWTETHCVYTSANYAYSSYGSPKIFYYYSSSTSAKTTNASGSGSAHNHTSGSSVTWSSESNLPPYYAVYLIQRKS